jgi:N-acetylglutamate synthase-like GNAT family acetyltransferase
MTITEYQLRAPVSKEEWRALHDIRRKVLFENRGKFDTYIENHPDDFKTGHHPLVLVYQDVVIGVVRVEVDGTVAWLRRVAIREDLQRQGHGRVLLQLAEAFAKAQGCDEVRSNAAIEAVSFYERCGYTRDLSESAPVNSVRMHKSLQA